MDWRTKMNWRSPKMWAVVTACFATALLLGYVTKSRGLASSETAAWVQAIGSVAAIVGTAWVANWQMRMTERASTAQKAEAWNHYVELLEIMFHQFSVVRDLCLEGTRERINPYSIDTIRVTDDLIKSFPRASLFFSAKTRTAYEVEKRLRGLKFYVEERNNHIVLEMPKEDKLTSLKIVAQTIKGTLDELRPYLDAIKSTTTPGS